MRPNLPSLGLVVALVMATAAWFLLFSVVARLLFALQRHPMDGPVLACSGLLLITAAVILRSPDKSPSRRFSILIGYVVGILALIGAVVLWLS